MKAIRLLFAGAFLLLPGCASGPAAASPTYTLALLRTGPTRGLPEAQQREVFRGHFANMMRMARAGELLLAGPFGEKRTDPTLRGLFVIDRAERGAAQAIAETDPGFQAGIFALEYHRLATAADLRGFLAAELAERDAATAAGETPSPGANGRGFVLLFADDGDRALTELQRIDAVVLAARLDDREALAVLDAEDLAAAEQVLGAVRDRLGPHRLEEWFASRNLVRLRPAGG